MTGYTTKFTLNGYGEMIAVDIKKIAPNAYADKDGQTYAEWDVYADPEILAEKRRERFEGFKRTCRERIDDENERIDNYNLQIEKIEKFMSELEHQTDGELCRQNEMV